MTSREIAWVRAARRAFEQFPTAVQRRIARALDVAARGEMAEIAKPLRGLGSGVFKARHRADSAKTAPVAGGVIMSEDIVKAVRGSGNVFRDLGLPDADSEQMKSALATEILKAMREQQLTHAAAAERAQVQRADISRICKVDLDRFTIDRLVRILNGLDRRVEVVVTSREVVTEEAV